MRILAQGCTLRKSDLTCTINLRYLSCQLINVPLMVATSWPKHAASTATQVPAWPTVMAVWRHGDVGG